MRHQFSEGLCELRDGRTTVAPVDVLGDRSIQELQHIDVEVDEERSGRQSVACRTSGLPRIVAEGLLLDHCHTERVHLGSLPIGGLGAVDPEVHEISTAQQRSSTAHAGQFGC